MPKRIYLDDAAATPVHPLVVKAMQPYWTEHFGNPASLHAEGVVAAKAVADAKKSLAQCIEALPDEIVITGSATEANNLAIFGTAGMNLDKRHVIASAIEHPSVMEPIKKLQSHGYEVTWLPVDTAGLIDVKQFEKALRPDTALASIIYASNEIGTIQPIAEIGKICSKRGIILHTDASQAAAWLPIRVPALHADLITINAAKMHGPKGVAMLYKRRKLKLKPILAGGGQEDGLRSGTENVPGIVGFATAFQWTRQQFANTSKVQELRDWFMTELLKIPGSRLNGHPSERLPNNVNVSFDGVDGETLVLGIDALGIAASSGSACSAIHDDGSPVLKAIGVGTAGNIRFSLDWTTTKKDLEKTVAAVKTVIERQRPVEAVWKKSLQNYHHDHTRN